MLASLEKVFKAVLLPKYPWIKDIVLESQKEDEVNYISCILIVDPENEPFDIWNDVSRNVYSLAKAMGLPVYGKEAWMMYSVFWRKPK